MSFVRPTLDRHTFFIAMAAIMALGLALRIAGARGDLSYDEIWSLFLLQGVDRPDQIFWKINHVNNHFLNSLWLYYVGPAASPFAQRALSIVEGMATIPAAGLWMARRGRGAVLVTMLFFAFALPMVSYGSEARGYAGLILCTILAACLVERAIEGQRRPWLIGVIVAMGFVNHLNMVDTAAALVAWTIWSYWRSHGPRQAFVSTFTLFLPAGLLTLPLAACVLPPMAQHRFSLGIVEPFNAGYAFTSWAALLRYSLRVGPIDHPPCYWFLAAAALQIAYMTRAVSAERMKFYLIVIACVPLALIACHLPNLDQPRYYLLSGIGLMLLLCELVCHPWQERRAHFSAIIFALLIVWGECDFTWRFLREGRGHYTDAIAIMTADGPATYGSDSDRNVMMTNYFSRRMGVQAINIPQDQWCATKPDWLLTFTFGHTDPAPERRFGPSGCEVDFNRPQAFYYFGMNGVQWNLYHRE